MQDPESAAPEVSWLTLYALLWDQGHLVVAAELGRATLKALEPNHSELSHAKSRLQHMLTHEGALVQAEKLARKTLDGLNARLGESHADAVSARENLALTLLQREQTKRSLEGWDAVGAQTGDLVDDAEDSDEGHLSFCADGNATTVQSPRPLALSAPRFSEDDEVGKLQWAVLQAREAANGPVHPDTIFAAANMAATLRQRGKFSEAIELLGGVLIAQRFVLEEEHPDIQRTLAELDVTLSLRSHAAHAWQPEQGAHKRART